MPEILPLTNGEIISKKEVHIVRAAVRLVVLRNINGQSECLFVKHPTKGMEFPGGAIEPNELPSIAALRELQEESGMVFTSEILEIKLLGFKSVIDARGGFWLDIILCTMLDTRNQIKKTTNSEFETKWLSLEQAHLLCRTDEIEFIAQAITVLSPKRRSS
jgi:8-oxo-dGTP pyrophosphatase MutT (NUDIX family)